MLYLGVIFVNLFIPASSPTPSSHPFPFALDHVFLRQLLSRPRIFGGWPSVIQFVVHPNAAICFSSFCL
jgi:hypothetical protein